MVPALPRRVDGLEVLGTGVDRRHPGRAPTASSPSGLPTGWITLTDGDTIDYDTIYTDVETDHELYRIVDVTYDKWCGEPVRQEIVKRTRLKMVESDTTYSRMTPPMAEFMRGLKAKEYAHYGNPVAWWMADNLECKSPRDDPDRIRPVKPDRGKTGKRIDGMPSMLFAIDGGMRGLPPPSIYETRGMAG
ncbi:hypothetical protein SMICM304S_01303 [Streptomyces microflavus]